MTGHSLDFHFSIDFMHFATAPIVYGNYLVFKVARFSTLLLYRFARKRAAVLELRRRRSFAKGVGGGGGIILSSLIPCVRRC